MLNEHEDLMASIYRQNPQTRPAEENCFVSQAFGSVIRPSKGKVVDNLDVCLHILHPEFDQFHRLSLSMKEQLIFSFIFLICEIYNHGFYKRNTLYSVSVLFYLTGHNKNDLMLTRHPMNNNTCHYLLEK